MGVSEGSKPTPNRTVLRHQALKAIDSGEMTMFRYLSLTPASIRTLNFLEEAGLIEAGQRGTYRQLTSAGTELLHVWNDQVRFGIGNADV